MQENSVQSQLEEQKKELADRTDFAFDHKEILSESKVEFQSDGSIAPKVDLDEAKAFTAEIIQKIRDEVNPEDIFLDASASYDDNKIEVTDSHLYPILLRMAFEKAINETGAVVPDSWVDQKIEEMLEHEYLHAVPGLASEGLKITYGVSVFKNDIQGGIDLQPYIGLNGTLSLLMHKDIVSNTDNKTQSARDREQLKWDK